MSILIFHKNKVIIFEDLTNFKKIKKNFPSINPLKFYSLLIQNFLMNRFFFLKY